MRRVLSCCVLLVGCGSATLSTGPAAETLVTVGGGQRAIVEVTDLDDVRDVAASEDRVFVATDHGLLAYALGGEEPPTRFTAFPSEDVTAVAAASDGTAVAAAGESIVRVSPDGTIAVEDGPPIGRVSDLHVDANGAVWACGALGVARASEGAWVRFGEDTVCTTFAATEGGLWIGTTRGLWLVEGEDTIREHGITRGIPEGFVRSIVSVGPGAILALLQGPGDTKIGYWDGDRWFSYTLRDFEPRPIGLARVGSDIVLVTPGRAFALVLDDPEAVPLTPLARSELRSVRSYRARITPADDVTPPAEGDQRDDPARSPSGLAEVPDGHPTIDAPAFSIRSSDLAVPVDAYLLAQAGEQVVFMADHNRGVARVTSAGAPTWYRSRDLVHATDFQIAIDASNRTWVLAKDGSLGRFDEGRLVRVAPPEGVEVQAISSGPQGAYLLTLLPVPSAAEGAEGAEGAEAPAPAAPAAPAEGEEAAPTPAGPTSRIARVYRVSEDGYTAVVERTITVNTTLVSAPLFAVGTDEAMWAGLRIAHENGEGTRIRGAVTFSPATEGLIYFYRGADPATDGEGSLAMPDEIDAIDLGMAGYAWFPSLNGAIRVGNHQAVVFGEARGVRGEVVSDVAVGESDRVWLAAAEGVGYYEDSTFEFRLPGVVQSMRPNRLAIDTSGDVWAVGPNGVAYNDGQRWHTLTTDNGLPTNELVDVEVDAQNRVWMLARDRVVLFTQRATPAPAQ